MNDDRAPVVFVHGMWLHADSWAPWLDHFEAAGYDTYAPGWPGEPPSVEAARKDPDAVAGHGIKDLVEHVAAVIATLPRPPVVVGHAFGGLIAQRLLCEGLAVAAVAIDAAPIAGVGLSPSGRRVSRIVLGDPSNRNGTVSLSPRQFRSGYANAVPRWEARELFDRWTVPSPGQPVFEIAVANMLPRSPALVRTANNDRGPLLLVAGGMDRCVPRKVTMATLRLYRISAATTDYKEFPDRGHSLVVDSGWQEIADHSLAWLDQALS